MLTIVERVIFLQNVDLFEDIASEQLSYLAAIAEEVHFLKDEAIFQQSDVADALYVVLQGKVRLHQDEAEIANAGPKEAFGTWALFDDEPRVVSATVLEDTRLLRIDREDFIDLLADHVQITRAILKRMAGRLRGLAARVGS